MANLADILKAAVQFSEETRVESTDNRGREAVYMPAIRAAITDGEPKPIFHVSESAPDGWKSTKTMPEYSAIKIAGQKRNYALRMVQEEKLDESVNIELRKAIRLDESGAPVKDKKGNLVFDGFLIVANPIV